MEGTGGLMYIHAIKIAFFFYFQETRHEKKNCLEEFRGRFFEHEMAWSVVHFLFILKRGWTVNGKLVGRKLEGALHFQHGKDMV